MFEKTLAGRRAALGRFDPWTLLSSSALIQAYWETAQWDKARAAFDQHLADLEASLSADPFQVPTVLAGLAELACVFGEPDRGISVLERYRDAAGSRLGADHRDTRDVTRYLGYAYRDNGRPDRAIAVLEPLLEAMRTNPGADDADTLETMRALASSYRRARRFDRATALFEELLGRSKTAFGPDGNRTLVATDGLAWALHGAGRCDEAVRLQEHVLERRSAIHGPNHPETLATLNNLAAGYGNAGRWDKAVPTFEESLARLTAKVGRDDPRTRKGIRSLALAYTEAGMPEKAEPLYRELLNYWVKRSGPDSEPIASAQAELGLNLLRQKKFAAAQPILMACLAFRLRTMPDDWVTHNAVSMLGDSLLGQGKHAEAERLLIRGYEQMQRREKTIDPSNRVRLTEALERIVHLYEDWGKKARSEEWRKKLDAHREAERKAGTVGEPWMPSDDL